MKSALCCFALFCLPVAGNWPAHAAFEQVKAGPQGAWRGRVPGVEILVLPEGFAVQHPGGTRRFRWHRSLGLETIEPGDPATGFTYVLTGSRRPAKALPRAERVRARSSGGALSILYYFGARGLEFDIEAEPGAVLPDLRLESLDADLSLQAGAVAAAGERLALKPVAYTIDAAGAKHPVSAAWRIEGSRSLSLDIGRYSTRHRLVIDPVMTYATYFGGAQNEEPVGLRELPDGSVLIGGNTDSPGFLEGVSLDSMIMQPSALVFKRCFVARVSPDSGRIHFLSYIGGADFTRCTAMDLDSGGRILLTGVSSPLPGLATPDAQYRAARGSADQFLARISADGRRIEYATYLHLDCDPVPGLSMRAGPGETAYLACNVRGSAPDVPAAYQQTTGPVVLLRYNIASRRFDQKTFFGSAGVVRGVQPAPWGSVFIFGETNDKAMPLERAFQDSPPTGYGAAGFVAAFSPDFRLLQFSTYIGGQGGRTTVSTLNPEADGSLWLGGKTAEGALPALRPSVSTDPTYPRSFALQIAPGNPTASKGFLLERNSLSAADPDGVKLPDGRFCLLGQGDPLQSSAGGAALGNGSTVPMLACANAEGSGIGMVMAAGAMAPTGVRTLVTPSRTGGIWSLHQYGGGGFPHTVPADFRVKAIQPFRINAYYDDLVLRHIDLTTPNPVLIHPQPLRLSALQGARLDSVPLAGRNFAHGMYLSVGEHQIPIEATGPTTATLRFRSREVTIPGGGSPIELRAGYYTGHLVIPVQPQPAVSEPFPVTVSNMAPDYAPFTPTSDPRVFAVKRPVYEDSQVRWNGELLPLTATEAGLRVRIPESAGMGDLVLVNPPPGGGVARQIVRFDAGSGTIDTPVPQTVRIPAQRFQVDRPRQVLYALADAGSGEWSLSAYNLPGGELLRTTSITKGGPNALVTAFALSADGRFLYLAGNPYRVTRFRTDPLVRDLEFQVPADAPPLNGQYEVGGGVCVFEDAPETVVAVTPAGRMIIYDGDRPRPYTTSDFPSLMIDAMQPVLASSSAVYAVRQADRNSQVPCLVRYPVDGFGFGPPEDFCNLGANWGKYPEMKNYAGALVLEAGGSVHGLLTQPDPDGYMTAPGTYDLSRNLSADTSMVSYAGAFDFKYHLVFSRLDTGERIGHFPRRGALNVMPGSVLFTDDAMVYFERQQPTAVVITSRWREAIEWYL